MRARRLPDGTPPREPGDYSYMPYSDWEFKPSFFTGEGEWHLIDPTGGIGAFGRTTTERPAAHSVEIHEDGSVTVTPSLVMPSGWHGFLIRGELTP